MSSRGWLSLLALLLVCLVSAAKADDAQPAADSPSLLSTPELSIPQYLADLDRLSSAAGRFSRPEDASTLIKTIPPTWRLQATEGVFEISSEWLRSDLGDWLKRPKRAIHDRI